MKVFLVNGDPDYVCAGFCEGDDIDTLRNLDFDNVQFERDRTFAIYPYFHDPASEGVVTDFAYCVLGSCLVMSPRAADALRDMLLPSGPLCGITDAGLAGYKLFACFRQLDALDPAIAEFHTCEPDDPFEIKRYGFKPEAIEGVDVFRTKPIAGRLFVSDRFRKRAMDAGLTGLRTQPLWASEIGPLTEFEYLGREFWPEPETAGMSVALKRERMRRLIATRDARQV